jgi:hypothetical protein
MSALEDQELLIIEEEAESLCEKTEVMNLSDEDSVAIETHKNQIQEIHEEIVERKKKADKKKKSVLERFQHVLEKDEIEQNSEVKIGSIHDKLKMFNRQQSQNGEETKKLFEDNALVGVSDVMSKVKGMFEAQEEDKLTLYKRDEIKRKINPTALKFEMMVNEEEDLTLSPKTPVKTEWSWKKKTP